MRGDVATAAKAVADYARATQLLPFKGGLMEGAPLDVEQIRSLSRLPSREVLYGQLVGVVASPVSGLVRTLSALLGGLASALGQVREKKESGEIPAGEPPAARGARRRGGRPAEAEAAARAAGGEPAAEEPAAEEPRPPRSPPPRPEAPAAEAEAGRGRRGGARRGRGRRHPRTKLSRRHEPAQEDDNQADVSAEAQPEDAETNPTKED